MAGRSTIASKYAYRKFAFQTYFLLLEANSIVKMIKKGMNPICGKVKRFAKLRVGLEYLPLIQALLDQGVVGTKISCRGLRLVPLR